MKINNIYGRGRLFAFSGLDGESLYSSAFCGYLLGDRIGIRFKYPERLDLAFVNVSFKKLIYNAVTSNVISAEADGEHLSMIALNQSTVIGTTTSKCDIKMIFESENHMDLFLEKDGSKFAFSTSKQQALDALKSDYDEIEKNRLSFYKKFNYSGEHEMLVSKCLSVMKTQIYTPEGMIKSRWSTPDRFPHKHMWLWDSVYHAIGFRHFDTRLSKELIEVIFTYQGEDGFIPHFSTPSECSKISQPPVIAYGALKVFEKDNDKEFLKRVFDKNKIFLEWCQKNRRKSDKNLYTWLTEPDLNCRCGESGMDNSTRFDTRFELYAIDFCCFMASECRFMAEIAKILGLDDEQQYYLDWFKAISKDINETLWNEEDGFYYDYDIENDCFHNIASVSSFLPLFAGVCDENRAKKLVEALLDESKFNTPFPIPTLPKESEYFGDDMWRGPVWINYNYLIAEGLADYSFNELSKSIVQKTIYYVEKYYLEYGTLYEFYDSADERSPKSLNRKGIPIEPYSPEVRYRTIRDYGWTTTLTFDLLLNS